MKPALPPDTGAQHQDAPPPLPQDQKAQFDKLRADIQAFAQALDKDKLEEVLVNLATAVLEPLGAARPAVIRRSLMQKMADSLAWWRFSGRQKNPDPDADLVDRALIVIADDGEETTVGIGRANATVTDVGRAACGRYVAVIDWDGQPMPVGTRVWVRHADIV